MKSQLYLYKKLRKKMMSQLTDLGELFIERIEPVFATPEKEAEEYVHELRCNTANNVNWDEDSAPDQEACDEMVWEMGITRYELLDSMKYRTICMWICCLCQVWEQQLYAWILHEASMEGMSYDPNDSGRGFGFVADCLAWHGVDYKSIQNGKIEELRDLVNVLKHGQGRSEEKLRIIRPDLFVSNGYDVMRTRNSTLIEPTLSVSSDDFKDYLAALVEFWNTFPERAYTQDDVPFQESEDSQ